MNDHTEEHDQNTAKRQSKQKGMRPPEGPHARSDLQDVEKTPGAGALSDHQGEVDVGPD